MTLQSQLFRGDPKLEAAAVSDAAHILPGATGPHVGKIQQALIQLDGAAIAQDSIYGPTTAAAVLAYKQKRNIVNRSYQTKADNIVGKMTIAALDREMLAKKSVLHRGMTGKDVADLQAALNYHLRPPYPPQTPAGPPRPPLTTDGIFGPLTEARLKEFQRLNRLVDDGVVGYATRSVLMVARYITVKIPIAKRDPNVSAAFGARPSFVLASQTQPTPSQSKPLLAPVGLQNRQVQLGGNLTLDPLIGPGATQKTAFLSVQWTWVEQKDGRHLELALGSQFATALVQKDPLQLGFSVQSFAQVTISDVIAFGAINFHLFSPSLQAAYQSNFINGILKSNSIAASVQNQITWDMVVNGKNPLFSLFCQQQLGWTYDLAARQGTVAPSFLVGAIWQTSFF
jgi:peptidoglycan hydrolase-like protein with peptidoglycan-binding domain